MQSSSYTHQIGPNNQYTFSSEQNLYQDNIQIVHSGHQTKNPSNEVAIKVLKFTIDKLWYYYPTLPRQMEIRSELYHPNLINLICYYTDPSYTIYIISQKGEKKILDFKNLSKQKKFKYIMQIVNVMKYLHHDHDHYCYLHRDLKPSNIYIDKNDNVKLGGLQVIKKIKKEQLKIDMMQTFTGTPLYSPIEILNRDSYCGLCDIWSAGCSFYQILTGQQLFCQAYDFSSLKQLIAKRQQKLFQKLQGEDDFLKSIIINKMLVDPQNRATFLQLFEQFQKHNYSLNSPIKPLQKTRDKSYILLQTSHPKINYRVPIKLFQGQINFDKTQTDPQVYTKNRIIGYKNQFSYNEKDYLGDGSFGVVWKGKRINPQQNIAVKQFYLNVKNIKQYDKFKNQHDTLQKLKGQHPNILNLIDFYINPNDRVFLITQLCDRSLAQEIRENYFIQNKEKKVLQHTKEIISAMKFMKQKGIVHRDLKPCNILIKNNHIKIADFGVATSMDLKEISLQLMQTNCGTLLYQSPQLLFNQKYNYKCDIWAIGCIIYEMLTGHRLFDGLQELALLQNINHKHIEKIKKELNPLNPFWSDLLSRMLQYNEGARISYDEIEKIVIQKLNKKIFIYNIKNT